MTTHSEFYAQVETGEVLLPRLQVFVDEYRRHRAALGNRPLDVLDVGCGEFAVLHGEIHPDDRYHGMDVKPELRVPLERYVSLDLNEDDLSEAFDDQRFDLIFCGEVLEHVFSPDRLLRQLKSIMHDQSLLILSTPNLAYWVNRLLLPVGISPLFVENSAEVTLGRRTRLLGQGNVTQGHVRLFTHRAALELFAREALAVERVRSVAVWNLFLDRIIARVSPHLAPDNVYLVTLPR